MSRAKESAKDRLLQAIDLSNYGIAMMRENLKRRHPRESRRQIERRLEQWLESRPLVEPGVPHLRPVDVDEWMSRVKSRTPSKKR